LNKVIRDKNNRYRILFIRSLLILLVATQGLLLPEPPRASAAPTFTLTTVIGDGQGRFAGDGYSAANASLYEPKGILIDPSGNLYIADFSNFRVRKVDANTGVITTIAGYDGGFWDITSGEPATEIAIYPIALGMDKTGTIYVADNYGYVRKINSAGIMTTYAGNGNFLMDNEGIPALNASIQVPRALAFDSAGLLYIADDSHQKIRKVGSDGLITTFAGTGLQLYNGDSGTPTEISLSWPSGLFIDAADNFYIADRMHHRIRKIDKATGILTTIAGTGTSGYSGDGGPAVAAELNEPGDIAIDGVGNIYFIDGGNHHIRVITQDGMIHTVDKPSDNVGTPYGLSVNSSTNDVYVTDSSKHKVYKIVGHGGPLTDVTATAENQQMMLAFSAPVGASTVVVQQSANDGANWTTATTGSAVTAASKSATVTGLTLGTTYMFRLVVTGGWYAGTSNEPSAMVSDAPILSGAVAGNGQVELTFTEPGSTAAPWIEMSADSGTSWSRVTEAVLTGSSISATVTGLTNGVTYRFRVVAPDGPKEGTSNAQSAMPFAPLTDLAGTGGNGRAELTFTAPAGATAVVLEQSADGGANWSAAGGVSLTAASTSATVTGLTNGTAYRFRLQVTDGGFRGASNVAVVTPSNAIGDLAAVPGDEEAELTFGAPAGATSVVVKQSSDGGATWSAATVEGALTAASTGAKVTGLTNGTTYRFRVDVEGGSRAGQSNVVVATPFAWLVGLQLEGVSFGPAVDRKMYAYNANVPYDVARTKAKLTLGGQGGTVTAEVLDGNDNPQGTPITLVSGQESDSIPLNIGVTKLKFTVFGGSVPKGTYTVAVRRDDMTATSAPAKVKVIVTDPATSLQQPSGPVNRLIGGGLSTVGYLLGPNGQAMNLPPFELDSGGSFTLPDVPPGQYKVALYTLAPTGEKLAGQNGRLTVDADGSATLEAELIDPYGIVTDAVTGKPVDGLHLTLRWADTELNRSKGRKPGERVVLPELPDFAPNRNHDPQTTVNGQYGWMVFPDGDYYITGEKEGFEPFDSRQDMRSETHGDDSYIRGGNIHVGVSIVRYDFGIRPIPITVPEPQVVRKPYMFGYEDGTFRPDGELTRAELTAMLVRVLPMGSDAGQAKRFADVPAGYWAAGTIDAATAQGWMQGYPNGEFAPKRAVTRAELSQTLTNVRRWKTTVAAASFTDTAGHWAAAPIAAAEREGVMAGFGDGTFRPDQAVTRAEAAAIFNRLLGRMPGSPALAPRWPDVPATHRAFEDIMEATVGTAE